MSCLFCRFFQPLEPAGHAEARTAGTCPDGCSTSRWNRSWTSDAAGYYVRQPTFGNLTGVCHLHPEIRTVGYHEICSQIDPVGYLAGTEVQPPNSRRETLYEWSQALLERHVHGDWQQRELRNLRADVQALRAELKASRQRSAARLATIKKLREPKKPKKQPAAVILPFAEAAE